MEATIPVTGNNFSSQFRPDRMTSFVMRFLNNIKKIGRSPHTISAYRNDLTLFSAFLKQQGTRPDDWTSDMLTHWLAFLNENGRHSEASTRRAIMSVRTFLRFLVGEGLIERSPILESRSPNQPTHDLLVISDSDWDLLCNYLRRSALLGDEKAVRDAALVLLLGECGLKASEAATLTWSDVVLGSSSGTLAVTHGNTRVVALSPEAALALNRLRDARIHLELPAGDNARLFFGYANLTRRVQTAFLHRHGIKYVIYEICQEILGTPYNAESLRNRAIRQWINEGLELSEVAKLAGYSSLQSLQRFLDHSQRTRKSKRRQKIVKGRR